MDDRFNQNRVDMSETIHSVTHVPCFFASTLNTEDAGRVVLGGGYAGVSDDLRGKIRAKRAGGPEGTNKRAG